MKKAQLYFLLFLVIAFATFYRMSKSNEILKEVEADMAKQPKDSTAWVGPSFYQIPKNSRTDGMYIWYGYELIAHTSKYLGPKGIVSQTTNGMNCQNCHLEAGTKPWGLNYGSVFSTYPKFRARSGTVESIYKRVNDCFERSLNGKALDTNSKEMQSIYAYIKWLGENVPKGTKVKGSGIESIPFLEEPANPKKGIIVYQQQCVSCHGADGQGKMNSQKSLYEYPPLWGSHSYNDGAGLYQISKLAGFIKNNMPNSVNYHKPTLTNQEAWDIAAYINAQPRPSIDKSKDWPVIATKPFDYPTGPYLDSFSESQHKFGPFKPIQLFYQKQQ